MLAPVVVKTWGGLSLPLCYLCFLNGDFIGSYCPTENGVKPPGFLSDYVSKECFLGSKKIFSEKQAMRKHLHLNGV